MYSIMNMNTAYNKTERGAMQSNSPQIIASHAYSPQFVGCGVFSSASTAVFAGSFERRNESWSGSVIMLH